MPTAQRCATVLGMRYQTSTVPVTTLPPREKLFAHGAKMLRDDELLAIILGTGVRRQKTTIPVSTLSALLIKEFGARGLFTHFNHPHELAAATELPPVKACILTAVGELLRRLQHRDRAEVSSPEDACRYFADLRTAEKEYVRVACLTPENLVFYAENAAMGDSNSVTCAPINIFNPPVRFYAQRILIAHNHPRGHARPSADDRAWHAELLKAATVLHIDIVDHIIIGTDTQWSFAMDGLVDMQSSR